MAEIILGLMGGLGLFLYGMRLMSDSLETVSYTHLTLPTIA